MSLHERQQAMRRRLEAERIRRDEERGTDASASSVSGHSPGMTTVQTQARSRPARSATDVQTDAPSARLLDLRAAGKYLGVSYWTMRDLVFGGLIPMVRIPCPRSGDGRVIRRVLIDR